MPKSINNLQQAPVPDEVLHHVADLAKVPDEQRDFFADSVREAIENAWEHHGLVAAWPTGTKIKTLESVASELYKLLHNLDNQERNFIDRLRHQLGFAFDRLSGEGGLVRAGYQFALLFSILAGEPRPAFPHQAPRKSQRGRSPGSVKDWIFQDFVFDLLMFAREAGGGLEFNKNRPGTPLVKAIRRLEAHLPADFVPRKLPGSTLQRIKTRFNQTRAEYEELENELGP
jgi:hypothetical protein